MLLRKQEGLTSFEALGAVKRALHTGKAGHTGTLDKFAGGLLLVLTGRALKLSPWFSHCDKQYEGLVRFGLETDTLDPEGETAAQAAVPSREAVERILPQFSGEIMQAPPVYSAVHIDGRRASSLARSGETPEMKKRPVRIYRLELLLWEPPFARIFVHCSGGTYIRSLARDIALAAGSRAYLHALTRTKVAGFSLADAAGGESFTLRPIDRAVFIALGLPWFEIEPQNIKSAIQGKPLAHILAGKSLVFPSAPPRETSPITAAGIFSGDSFIAMIEKDNGRWKYGYVYAQS